MEPPNSKPEDAEPLQPSRKRPRSPSPATSSTRTKTAHAESGSTTQRVSRYDETDIDSLLSYYEEEACKDELKEKAELERRRNLTPDERLAEDREKLLAEILASPRQVTFLEISRSQRASCQAKNDCFYPRVRPERGRKITDECRIRFEGATNYSFWAPLTHYYHVKCFERMVDLRRLIPGKFKLDPRNAHFTWGLMIRKWYEHKGQIDLDKIAAHLQRHRDYEQQYAAHTKEYGDWYWKHYECDKSGTACACPPRPAPMTLKRPGLLGDCATGGTEDCVSLDDVASHPFAYDMTAEGEEQLKFMLEVDAKNAGSGPSRSGSGQKSPASGTLPGNEGEPGSDNCEAADGGKETAG